MLTATYANAVYDAFPEVNNRLREPCQLQHAFGTPWKPNGVIYVIGMPKKPEHELTSLPQKDVAFVEPMEGLAVSKLPDAAPWIWGMKIDGYRAIAVKSNDNVNSHSRTRKSFNRQFSYIVEALADMPSGTVIDGEL